MEQLKDNKLTDSLVEEAQKLISTHFKDKNLHCDPKHIRTALKWSSGRLTSLNDLVSSSLAFLWILPQNDLNLDEQSLKILKDLIVKLEKDEGISYKSGVLKSMLREFCSANDFRFNHLMKLLRSVLSGLEEGPGVAEMIEVLGRDTTIERINKAIRVE